MYLLQNKAKKHQYLLDMCNCSSMRATKRDKFSSANCKRPVRKTFSIVNQAKKERFLET